jgi:drug/metabolite transporter (DMT)-like permease
MSGPDWALLVALSVLWGGSFFFAKVAVAEIGPVTVAFGRVAIAAVLLAAFVRASGLAWPRSVAQWRAFAVMGFLNNAVPFTLIFWGQTHIASGLAAILNATTPLFTVMVAHAFTTDEKLTLARGLGVTIGFLGVVVMIGPDFLRALGADVAAQLACLAAALSYAFANVYGRRFRPLAPGVVAGGQFVASTVMLAPIAAVIERPWTLAAPSAGALAAVLALAVLSTALGYLIFFRILRRAGATNISLVTFLIPVSAILLGSSFLGETLALRHFAGMAAIMLGLAAIDGRPAAAIRRIRPNNAEQRPN